MRRVLIANRGEIAIRIARTAADLGVRTIAVYSEDDAQALHRFKTDSAVAIPGNGPAAYLDAEAILRAAREAGIDAIHPGYGFLAESAAFAARCAQLGITFVGPGAPVLEVFGDKAAARQLAERVGVPVLPGSNGPVSLDDARAFLQSLGPGGAIMLKAVAGGGGRGMRPVHQQSELAEAYERCASEAASAFGDGTLYVEQLFPRARHLEVQVLGDGSGRAVHLWERDCSLQRQRQKLVEIAPAPNLEPELRARIVDAALRLAREVRLDNLATMEFLVDGSAAASERRLAFIEGNARLQVEHTVTEEITGLDLVELQLELAAGRRLNQLQLTEPPVTRGVAVQLRVNIETMDPSGAARPGGGTLTAYEPPSGRGVRVDGYGYAGYTTNPRFDSLLAKLVVHGVHGHARTLAKAANALAEFKLEGVPSNIGFLRALLADAEVIAGDTHTGLLEAHADAWVGTARRGFDNRYFVHASTARLAGARVDTQDPLAVLEYGHSNRPTTESSAGSFRTAGRLDVPSGPPGTVPLAAPMQGTIVSIGVAAGAAVHRGQAVLVMEAMKMEHVVAAPVGGYLREFSVQEGETVFEGHPLAFIEEAEVGDSDQATTRSFDLDLIRDDLAEVQARKAKTLDASRPDAVQRRHRLGYRTMRENVEALIDPGSFVEYGALTLAARRLRMSMQDLIDRTPADGLICGLGRINGQWFDDEAARAMVVAYDYTVLAGTQGKKNHQKKDRMFKLAAQWRTPLVLFAEGGGGRPGDTDVKFGANLQVEAFHLFGKLSGLVPLVGISNGRCFAGNAVLLGCCDVIIATQSSTIGMGGPAMIEGGGLGVFTPEEVGPMSVQVPNGVV
ncbi:MAG: carbamoyl-phosphate synthase large subunit, partial [Gammaproteobacteria bacterium]|nr:carbamoyl-phosphate synthase large subunit [Gammaproteobacteria bacterium]